MKPVDVCLLAGMAGVVDLQAWVFGSFWLGFWPLRRSPLGSLLRRKLPRHFLLPAIGIQRPLSIAFQHIAQGVQAADNVRQYLADTVLEL